MQPRTPAQTAGKPSGSALGRLAGLLMGLLVGLPSACSGGSSDPTPAPPEPTPIPLSATIDAGTVTGQLRPLWRDHYDLSFEHFSYPAEPGFLDVFQSLEPRSFRCSVGRWEVGFPPPPGGDGTDVVALQNIDREFYRGPNTLAGADDPSNYRFDYLDRMLRSLLDAGAEPYLCFDYMPWTLAAEQNPNNPNNYNLSQPGSPYSTYSYSNGIRTSPPADPAVYARVVRNSIRHVRGLFAGTVDFGIEWIEIGNEPDLLDGNGAALGSFYTGTEEQFFNTYAAIAAAVDADASITSKVQLGAASFAFLPSVAGTQFMRAFLVRTAAATPRLDFLSYHSYGDLPEDHLGKFQLVNSITTSLGIQVPWVNAEWGRNLGDREPAYDGIEHGIFRAKVLGLMQIFPFQIAHEAVMRDPGTSGGELGLIRTGPPAHKPVSQVYRGLNRLNETLESIAVTANPDGLYVLSGRDAAGDRVRIAVILDTPPADSLSRVTLRVENLPWGVAPCTATLARVTFTSAQSSDGIEQVEQRSHAAASLDYSFEVRVGDAGLYLLELEKQ